MKRGRLEILGQLLQKVVEQPNWAPSRISGSLSLTYDKVPKFVKLGFVEIIGEGYQRRLVLTPKGRQFLEHYRFCDHLLPEGSI